MPLRHVRKRQHQIGGAAVVADIDGLATNAGIGIHRHRAQRALLLVAHDHHHEDQRTVLLQAAHVVEQLRVMRITGAGPELRDFEERVWGAVDERAQHAARAVEHLRPFLDRIPGRQPERATFDVDDRSGRVLQHQTIFLLRDAQMPAEVRARRPEGVAGGYAHRLAVEVVAATALDEVRPVRWHDEHGQHADACRPVERVVGNRNGGLRHGGNGQIQCGEGERERLQLCPPPEPFAGHRRQ